ADRDGTAQTRNLDRRRAQRIECRDRTRPQREETTMTSTITETALFLSRWIELSVLSKATILLVLGLAAAVLAARSRASVRHLALAATFAALLALPLIIFTAPSVRISLSVSRVTPAAVVSLGPAAE